MEPTTSAAGGYAGWKLLMWIAGAGTMGALLASIVVMCVMTPRNAKEWAIGLISTVVCSIGGGATVIQYLELQHWAHNPFGLVAMLGLVFVCGLPGWAIVRWVFNYIHKREGQGIDDLIKEWKNDTRAETTTVHQSDSEAD